MELTGRITADAKINKLTDGREVTAFTLVMNDNYKTKAGEKKQIATFINCSYWVSSKAAEHIRKGTIICIYGRIGMNVYKNQEGEPQGSLTFHVNDIKFIANPAKATIPNTAHAPQAKDDLPF